MPDNIIILSDRIKELSNTTGAGNMQLEGAANGFSSFGSAYADNAYLYYAITDGTNYEIGSGQYQENSYNELVRFPFRSSNNNGLVNWPIGTKEIYVTYPATHSVYTGSGWQGYNLPQSSGLAFWESPNTLNYDSSGIWDSTNKRIGLATSSPEHAIHIGGDTIYSHIKASGFSVASSGLHFPSGNSGALGYSGGIQLEHFVRNELGSHASAVLQLSGIVDQQIQLKEQCAGFVFASPVGTCGVESSGRPSFRALVAGDIPDLSATYVAVPTVSNAPSAAQSSGVAVWHTPSVAAYDGYFIWNSGLKRLGVGNPLPLATLDVSGNAIIHGTTSTDALHVIGVTNILDKSLEIASMSGTATMHDAILDGGGLILRSSGDGTQASPVSDHSTDKNWVWKSATQAWTTEERIDTSGIIFNDGSQISGAYQAGSGLTLDTGLIFHVGDMFNVRDWWFGKSYSQLDEGYSNSGIHQADTIVVSGVSGINTLVTSSGNTTHLILDPSELSGVILSANAPYSYWTAYPGSGAKPANSGIINDTSGVYFSGGTNIATSGYRDGNNWIVEISATGDNQPSFRTIQVSGSSIGLSGVVAKNTYDSLALVARSGIDIVAWSGAQAAGLDGTYTLNLIAPDIATVSGAVVSSGGAMGQAITASGASLGQALKAVDVANSGFHQTSMIASGTAILAAASATGETNEFSFKTIQVSGAPTGGTAGSGLQVAIAKGKVDQIAIVGHSGVQTVVTSGAQAAGLGGTYTINLATPDISLVSGVMNTASGHLTADMIASGTQIRADFVAAGGESNQNAFSNITTPDSVTVAAESATDTVTFQALSGVAIIGTASTDAVAFSAAPLSGVLMPSGAAMGQALKAVDVANSGFHQASMIASGTAYLDAAGNTGSHSGIAYFGDDSSAQNTYDLGGSGMLWSSGDKRLLIGGDVSGVAPYVRVSGFFGGLSILSSGATSNRKPVSIFLGSARPEKNGIANENSYGLIAGGRASGYDLLKPFTVMSNFDSANQPRTIFYGGVNQGTANARDHRFYVAMSGSEKTGEGFETFRVVGSGYSSAAIVPGWGSVAESSPTFAAHIGSGVSVHGKPEQSGALTVTPINSNNIGVVVQANASQGENLLEFRASNKLPTGIQINASGELVGGNNNAYGKADFFAGPHAALGAKDQGGSIAIGYWAAVDGDCNDWTTMIGAHAGRNAIESQNGFFAGFRAGSGVRNSSKSIAIGQQALQQASGANQVVALGYYAGKEMIGSVDSIAIGNQAAYQASGALEGVMIGDAAGWKAHKVYKSIFMGKDAGASAFKIGSGIGIGVGALSSSSGAENLNTSNFMIGIGYGAGKQSVKSQGLIGIGFEAGAFTEEVDQSIYIGSNAGRSSKTSNNSIMMGVLAGYYATGVKNSVVIGRYAGYTASQTDDGQDVFIGDSAGYDIESIGSNVAIGTNAARELKGSAAVTAIGSNAGKNADTVSHGVFIGTSAGVSAHASPSAGFTDHSTADNIGIGQFSLAYLNYAQACIAIGYRAGYKLGDHEGAATTQVINRKNIMVGHAAGAGALGDGNIYIGSDHCGTRVQGDRNLFLLPLTQAGIMANTNNALITDSNWRSWDTITTAGGLASVSDEEIMSDRINICNTIAGASADGSRSIVVGAISRTKVDDTTSALTVVPDNSAQKGVMLDWDTANSAPLLAAKTDPLKTGLTSIPNSTDFSTNTIVNQNGWLTIPTFKSYDELITAIPENASNEGAIAMYFNRKDTTSNRRSNSGWRMVVLMRYANATGTGGWADGGGYKWHELPTSNNNFTWDWYANDAANY